jgi:CDP-diacylglycerol--glycerol-3-phosphate 3-phosphatidyltransferase
MRTDLAIFAALVAFALASMPVYAWSGARRQPDPNAPSVKGSFVLGSFVRDWFYWFLRPVDRLSLAIGLGPLFYNLTGVFFGVLSGVLFAIPGWTVAAGWSVLMGGIADIMDGRIARARGIANRRGAFIDSTLDRFAEFGSFVGLAARFGNQPLALVFVVAGLGGSLLVSYTRARGESVGVLCKEGLMQRAERLMLLGFAGIFDPAVSAAVGRENALLIPALGLIAVGTVGTAIYRTVWIARRLPLRDS